MFHGGGVSYVVADGDGIDWAAMLHVLDERFGLRRLPEGGGIINGGLLAAGLVDELGAMSARRWTVESRRRAPFRSARPGWRVGCGWACSRPGFWPTA